MNIKEIVEGMTAPQVAQVIKDNFNEVDKDKANKTDLNKSISDLASVVEANKTDLTKKIDNNKEDTDEKLSELGSLFVYNGYVNHNGKLVKDSGSIYRFTTYIPMVEGDVFDIVVYYGSTNIAACYVYDENKKPVGEYNLDGTATIKATLSINDVIAQYPNGKYFVLCGKNSDNPKINYSLGKILRFNEYKDKLAIDSQINMSDSLFIYKDLAYNKNGILIEVSGYAHSVFIPIVRNEVYQIRGYETDENSDSFISPFSIFDENLNYLGYISSGNNAIVEMTVSANDVLASYPSAAYFVVSASLKHENELPYIAGINDFGSILKYRDAEIQKYYFQIKEYVNHEGLMVESTTYNRSDFIQIKPSMKYAARLYYGTTNIAACSLFDDNFNYIGEYLFEGQVGLFYVEIETDNILESFSNAVYMVLVGLAGKSFINGRRDSIEISFPLFANKKIREIQETEFMYEDICINHSGVQISNIGKCATHYIPIIKNHVYEANIYFGPTNVSACYLYDEKKEPIGEYLFEGKKGEFVAEIYANDLTAYNPNCRYFRLSGNVGSAYIIGLSIIDVIKDKMIIEEVEKSQRKSLFVYAGRYYNKYGVEKSNSSFSHSVFIPLIKGKNYRIKGYETNEGSDTFMSPCQIFDKDKNSLGYMSSGKSGVVLFNVNADDILEQYPTAAYLIVSGSNTTEDRFPYIEGIDDIEGLIYAESNSISIKDIEEQVKDIEEQVKELDNHSMVNAAQYDALNKYRENELRTEYQNKIVDGYTPKWYGVQFTEEENPDNVIAIGDSELHDTLPIQSKIRRCVTLDNVVQYYLDKDNSELKVDGTAANLDGTDGNVMVEIPEFFYKVEDELVDSIRTIRIKISEDAIPDFIYSAKRYTSAYEATINRETGLLASVCTTIFTRQPSESVGTASSSSYIQGTGYTRKEKTARRNGHTVNAATYRGGTNDASLDVYESVSDYNYSRNQLGIPVANINRKEIRAACEEHQFGYLYDTQRILYMLIQVEFKTRNIQKSIASGGLGVGATRYPSYTAYESFFSPQGGISCIPCGVTNSLGNKSGEVYYLMENVPISQTKDDSGNISYTFGNVWMPCMSYRGIEHYYGHLYKIADQVDCMTGETTGYVEGHEDDNYWSLHDVTWWYEKNPYLAKNGVISMDRNKLGTWNFPCHIMNVSSLLMGKHGHVLHIGADGKDYGKNYCDCSELDASPNRIKYVTFNGRIVSFTLVGNHFIVSHNIDNGNSRRPSDGTRVDHF